MDNINELAAALAKAQSKMEGATKDTANPFFKSKYADLAACVEAVIDALNDNGIALIQKQHPNETGVSGSTGTGSAGAEL
jgi:phage tail protein X